MKKEFGFDLFFLSQEDEAVLEAASYRRNSKDSFEKKYVLQGKKYSIISIGSTSAQAFKMSEDGVASALSIRNSTQFGTSMVKHASNTDMKRRAKEFVQDLQGAVRFKHILVNSVGYGVVELRRDGKADGGDPTSSALLKIGLGAGNSFHDEADIDFISYLHRAAQSTIPLWVQPRGKDIFKIQMSWAKEKLEQIKGSACVVDVGGGVSVTAFCRLQDGITREGDIKDGEERQPVNVLFKQYNDDAIMLALSIGGRVQLAVLNALKMMEWSEVEATNVKIFVMQTGEMRNVYFQRDVEMP